jgi:hypothetical protein
MKSYSIVIRSLVIVSMLVLLVAAFPLSAARAQASGPFDPGTGINVPGIGSEVWQNPGEISTPGSPYATVTLDRDNRYSNYLQATQYSFAIPLNVNISGIEVTITRSSTGSSPSIYDNVVSLVKASGTPGESVLVGDNHALPDQWTKNSFVTVTYGGPTDLWGTSWTPAEINDPDFGVTLAVSRQNMGNNLRDAVVDSMQITVYFTFATATVSVDCGNGSPEVTYGDEITCKATVSNAGYLTPTGTVSWATSGNGSFDFETCDLAEVSSGVAACEVVYTPHQVGEHLISADYGGDTVYDPSSGEQTVTVNPKPASVTPQAASKVYGDSDPALTGSLDGFLAVDNISAVYSREEGESVLGGPYKITAVLSPEAALANYDITYNTAEFSITPRPIAVTADAQSKVVGQPDPELTYHYTGSLAYSDSFSGSLTRQAGELVGTYAIQQGTLALDDNYLMSYNGAELTITPQTLYFVQIYR